MTALAKLQTPFLHTWWSLQKRFSYRSNPERVVRLRYLKRFGQEPDLKNPRTVNEKVLWMMLHADTSRWTQLADKLRVREYVEACGLGDLLIDLYGVWGTADEIDFAAGGGLRTPCVLKTNNGCGYVIPVRDLQQINPVWVRCKLNHALRRRYGLKTAELHYLPIEPRVFAERMLEQDPAEQSSSLIDYKFYCVDGKPVCCGVFYDRDPRTRKCKMSLYDAETWESLDCYATVKAERDIPRPASLERMYAAAARLSEGFPFIRIDLYSIGGKPYFGEMTFTPASGLSTRFTDEYQRILGDRIVLPPAVR